jgi:hypothetical protein
MQGEQPSIKRNPSEFKDDSSGEHVISMFAANPDVAVTRTNFGTRPRPTRVGTATPVDVTPKSLNELGCKLGAQGRPPSVLPSPWHFSDAQGIFRALIIPDMVFP